METENIKLIGKYQGVPVYRDKSSTNLRTFWRARGPIPEHKDRNQPGLVYYNHETGKTTLLNGEPWVLEKVDYETKGYFVGTDDIEEAISIIKQKFPEKWAVFEKVPAHGSTENSVILSPYNSKEEAESAREKYGYGTDNYYVDVLKN